MLRFLADAPKDRNGSKEIVSGLLRLDPTQEDKRQARKVVLGSLVNTTDSYNASQLVNTLARLGPTQQDKREGRKALFGVLADPANNRNYVKELVEGLVQLGLTQEEQRQAARSFSVSWLTDLPVASIGPGPQCASWMRWRGSTRPVTSSARPGKCCLLC